MWYIDGMGSSGSDVEACRDGGGDGSVESCARWTWLQYLQKSAS